MPFELISSDDSDAEVDGVAEASPGRSLRYRPGRLPLRRWRPYKRSTSARTRSRNLKWSIMYDFRIGARIARQACMALCQYALRFGADRASAEALADAQAKVRVLDEKVRHS